MLISLTLSSQACSQTLADSIKRNIIEVGMRYDSLRHSYQLAIVELEQREAEIKQLNRVIQLERQEFETDRRFYERELGITKKHLKETLTTLSKKRKQRFIIGPYTGVGLSSLGFSPNIGIGLTYKLISF